MADEVKLGIIGTGQIGKMHLHKYRQVPGAKMVAACDIDEKEVRRVAAEYGTAAGAGPSWTGTAPAPSCRRPLLPVVHCSTWASTTSVRCSTCWAIRTC